MSEPLIAQIVILVTLAMYSFVAGGAMAGGAWVVWRLLERRRSEQRPAAESSRSRLPWLMGLAVLGAVSFALIASRQPGIVAPGTPDISLALTFVPFLVMASLAVAAVWLVRRAIR